MRGSLFAVLLPALLAVCAVADEVECPAGTERVLTDNPYEPFRCVAKDKRRKGSLSSVVGPTGFAVKPRCPPGSRPVPTPAALQPYRCVMSSAAAAEPDLRPSIGEEGRVGEWEAPEAGARGQQARRRSSPGRFGEKSFMRYSIPGELSFDFPKDWHLTDGWKDEPPIIYVVYDEGSAGKQVTMTITASEPGQAGYQSVELAILKEKEWQNAVAERGEGRVAGLRTRFVSVPGSSRSAYVEQGRGRYLTVAYSAPAELYEPLLPAFQRLLKSLRVAPR